MTALSRVSFAAYGLASISANDTQGFRTWASLVRALRRWGMGDPNCLSLTGAKVAATSAALATDGFGDPLAQRSSSLAYAPGCECLHAVFVCSGSGWHLEWMELHWCLENASPKANIIAAQCSASQARAPAVHDFWGKNSEAYA